MHESKVISILSGLVVAGSVVGAVVALGGGWGAPFDPRPHEASGWGMAREALRLLKPGGHVVVVTRDTQWFKNPAVDRQLASFRRSLAAAHATISTVESLKVDPLRPITVPPGDFAELLRKTASSDVIVSFMGVPTLDDNQRARLRSDRPAVLAFCPGNTAANANLPVLFEQVLVQAAVVSRPSVNGDQTPSSDPQACFEQNYQAITTAEAAARLGAPAGGQP